MPARPLDHDGERSRDDAPFGAEEPPIFSLDPLVRTDRTGPSRSRSAFVDQRLNSAHGRQFVRV